MSLLRFRTFALIGLTGGLPSSLIAGGGQMSPNEHQYLGILLVVQDGLQYPICSSVLVSPNKVVTTARCMSDTNAVYMVRLGEHSLSQGSSTEQLFSITSTVIHPEYNGNAVGFPGDIAVLTLDGNADTTSPVVSTIDLISSGADVTGQNCTISGWGSTYNSGGHQDYPLKATFPAISQATCRTRWADQSWGDILDSHVCMDGALSQGQSACHMDQGGPMTCDDGNLVGIISWGESNCNGTNHPTVMASIAHYHDWITQNL